MIWGSSGHDIFSVTRCEHLDVQPDQISAWMFPKIGGKPQKWMVKIMENPIEMDDLGVPLFLETPTSTMQLMLFVKLFSRQMKA